jgi:nucleoside-diphosphate-sugar epimerase
MSGLTIDRCTGANPGSGTVFVTGGTGFVGDRLVAALLARGRTVRALARPGSEPAAAERLEWVTGDILDRDSLRRGLAGCAEVYHLAAYARNWARDPGTFFRLNVEGARNVFEAAAEEGVGRIVYTSTVVTFGPTRRGAVGDEEMSRTTPRFRTEYEESKAVAGKEALGLAARGFPIVLVHPTRVYGPGKLTEGNTVSTMLDQYDRGRFPILLGGGEEIGNYALVDDIVNGHLLAMENGRVGAQYILGGENVSMRGLFRLVDELTGRRHLQVALPRPLAMGYAGLEKRKGEWLGIHPRITPGWVETFLEDWAYTSARAERELGYRITPLREGIGRTLDWLHSKRGGR